MKLPIRPRIEGFVNRYSLQRKIVSVFLYTNLIVNAGIATALIIKLV